MSNVDAAFLQTWPKCLVGMQGMSQTVVAILLCVTELGNIGANFWRRNVFAGFWSSMLIVLQAFALFSAGR
jgi:hypothetical protein